MTFEAPRILFIVKYREDSGGACAPDTGSQWTGGLYHSAQFVVQMMNSFGVWAHIEQVFDNNGIDAAVTKWQPTTVIIEGLWVVPEKFVVLQRLHLSVSWIIRCHSEIPFLAYEGIAIDWLTKYVQYGAVSIANNSQYGTRDFEAIISAANPSWDKHKLQEKVVYLPNWYPAVTPLPLKNPNSFLDVGCFGAIRPLKNHLIQGLAAVEWAKQQQKTLRFHVNGRIEQGGDRVVKNLIALMRTTNNLLVQHAWAPRDRFLQRLADMDVAMQVSLSETFNITAADSVSLGIPLVSSNEIVWSSPASQASATNTASIVARLSAVTGRRKRVIVAENRSRLREFCRESEDVWLDFAQTS